MKYLHVAEDGSMRVTEIHEGYAFHSCIVNPNGSCIAAFFIVGHRDDIAALRRKFDPARRNIWMERIALYLACGRSAVVGEMTAIADMLGVGWEDTLDIAGILIYRYATKIIRGRPSSIEETEEDA
jgi:hypothetical protein